MRHRAPPDSACRRLLLRGRSSGFTSGDGSSRRPAGAGARRRGCRSASSRARRDRAAPGSSGGRRRPRAGASRTRAGGGAGSASAVATSTCRGSGRAPRGRASRSRRVRGSAGRRGGRRRRRTPLSRRAGRRAPSLPCRATCTVSWSKSTSASRRPTTSALRSPQEYVSSRIAPLRSASGPSPPTSAIAASTSASFGASGRRRRLRGGAAISGTRAAPSVKRMYERTAASRRAIVDGASPRRPRPSSAVYSASACTSTSVSVRPVRCSHSPKSARSAA